LFLEKLEIVVAGFCVGNSPKPKASHCKKRKLLRIKIERNQPEKVI
jgi:hypothetical protein